MPTRLLSVHKVYQALKSQGFRLTKDAAYDDGRPVRFEVLDVGDEGLDPL